MRVDLVDPSAFTPPYDRALAAALARAGADVRLVTSRFAYGDVPPAHGYEVDERFYRVAAGRPGSRLRRAAKLASHVPDMLAYRRAARAADVVHFQWLTVQPLDLHLLPARPAAGAHRPRRPAARAPPGSAAGAAAALRASGRRRRPLPPRPRAPGGRPRRRSREGQGHPPRRVHPPRRARARPASRAARRDPRAGRALLRAPAPLQGGGRPPRRVARHRRRGAVGRRNAAHAPRPAARHRAEQRAVAEPLRVRHRGRRAVPARGPRRAPLPRDRPVRGALHRAGLRQASAAVRGRRLSGDRRGGRRRARRPGRPRGAAPRAAQVARRSRPARGARGCGPHRGCDDALVGASGGRPSRPLRGPRRGEASDPPCTFARCARAHRRLLGLGRPARLHAGRLRRAARRPGPRAATLGAAGRRRRPGPRRLADRRGLRRAARDRREGRRTRSRSTGRASGSR